MSRLWKHRTGRLLLLAVPTVALAAVALVLAFGPGGGTRVEGAQNVPHPGLDFSIGVDIDGDGTNDCGSGVPSAVGDGAPDPVAADVTATKCTIDPGSPFDIYVYLMAFEMTKGLDSGYDAQASHVQFTGGVAPGAAAGDAVWAGCVFEAPARFPNFENVGCTIGLPPAGSETNLGLMSIFADWTCTESGTLSLGHDLGETLLTDSALAEHREAAADGPDLLTVNCGGEPVPTMPPTATPTRTSTPVPTTPPAATNTPTPTRTRTPVPPSPTPAKECGDVNDNGTVNSIDAQLILQFSARLLMSLVNPSSADTNGDGDVNSVDAALILQLSAGLVDELEC